MGKHVYTKTALTGNDDTALDGIDGALLNNLDIGIVTAGGMIYFYLLDHDNSSAESSPGIICPNRNYGTKRWVLQSSSPGAGDFSIAGDLSVVGDVYSVAAYNFASSAVGWAATPTIQVVCHKVGKLAFIFVYITGTGNTTSGSTTTFTVPWAAKASPPDYFQCQAAITDGGANQVHPGQMQLAAGGSTVTVYKDNAGSGWTASGNKVVLGMLIYETA